MSCEIVPSKFSLYCFSAEIDSQTFKYDIIKMTDSLLVFVNLKENQLLEDLSYAIVHPRNQMTTSIQILGNFIEDASRNLVHHLSKRLGKNIYLSLNVTGDRYLYARIEQQLFEEIKNNYDKF